MPTNLDPQELAKFSQGDWWDEHHGAYALLHQLNPIRLEFVAAQTAIAGKITLDVGCGGGILTEALAKTGAQVTGLDLNQEALAQAREHAAQESLTIDYQHCSIEAFAEKNPATFELITCMEMLEHVPDPASVIASCSQLLKPNGIAVFSTINRNLQAYAEAVIAAEYILRLLPRGTHDYQKFIKPSELCEAARQHGLDLIALSGLNYNPLNKTFSLSNNPKTNYLAAFRKVDLDRHESKKTSLDKIKQSKHATKLTINNSEEVNKEFQLFSLLKNQ